MTYTEQDKKLIEEFQNFADSIVWSNDDGSEKYIGVGNMADWWLDKIHQALAEERKMMVRKIEFVKTNIAWDRTRGIDADSGDDAKQIGWDGACDLILFSLKPLTDKE